MRRATKAAYKDVEPLWDAAQAHGGAMIQAKSPNAALQIVQRLHKYRVIDREGDQDNVSILDKFIVRRTGAKVEISVRDCEVQVTTIDGAPVDMQAIKDAIASWDRYVADQTLKKMGIDTSAGDSNPFDPDKPLDL